MTFTDEELAMLFAEISATLEGAQIAQETDSSDTAKRIAILESILKKIETNRANRAAHLLIQETRRLRSKWDRFNNKPKRGMDLLMEKIDHDRRTSATSISAMPAPRSKRNWRMGFTDEQLEDGDERCDERMGN